MNKYDFDFKRIEDILYDVLGISNPTDIMSLKLQIRESLNSLSEAIDRKNAKFAGDPVKAEIQKSVLYRELNEIAAETDLEKILRKCITVRYLVLLSLDVKIRLSDSYEEKNQKNCRRNEIFAVSSLVKSVPSVLELMEQRDNLLRHIDSKNRIIKPKNNSSTHKQDVLPARDTDIQIQENSDSEVRPPNKLDIQFTKKPRQVSGEYGELLEQSGIYAYKFGDLVYTKDLEDGKYTQLVSRKNLVGIIKKDEFGELKKYTILMNDFPNNMPPEFCRDILFSDMLLRNSKNNFGFIGIPSRFPQDRKYKYAISFSDFETEQLIDVLAMEENQSEVLVSSNLRRIRSMNSAFLLMQEKLEQAIKEVFERNDEKNEFSREVGDDQ